MRLARPRLTIRRLMFAVLLVALYQSSITVYFRWKTYPMQVSICRMREGSARSIARSYAETARFCRAMLAASPPTDPATLAMINRFNREKDELQAQAERRAAHWSALADRYSKASRTPWRSLPPDPPEPD